MIFKSITLLFCFVSLSCSLYTFYGVANSVPISTITNSGWTVCHTDSYGTSGKSLSQIRASCNGSLTMIACHSTGSSSYSVAAYANSSDVWYPTGTGNVPHNANGVGWYYDPTYSMGFAPYGATLSRNSCDTGSTSASQRICFHTRSNALSTGWRCGSSTSVSSGWNRVFLTSNIGTCETDADCYNGYGVCVSSYNGKHCSCLSGFSGTNCTIRPAEVCEFSNVQANTTRFDPSVNFDIINNIITLDVLANLENNKFINPSENDTTTTPPYSLETTINYGSVPTPCDYPNGGTGRVWNKTVEEEYNEICEDRWRSSFNWAQAKTECGFSDPDNDNIWTQIVTVSRRYQLPSLPDGTPITRVEKITKRLSVVFPNSVQVTTGVAIYGPEAVSVSSVVEVSYSPSTDQWSVILRTYTGKPYKLSTPIIRFANGNLINRNVSSSVVETPACTDQTLPCSQLISLFFRGCTGLEGTLTVETTPICSVAIGSTCPPINQKVYLNLTVSSANSCAISNNIEFSETALGSFSGPDCTVPRTLFAASDIAYFGGIIKSVDVDVNMVFTVSSVCFVYNNGPCISIAFNQLTSANGRDPVFALNLAQSRFFTNSTEMQSFVVQATISVSWQNSKRTLVIKAESNLARVNIASSIGISGILQETSSSVKEQESSNAVSLLSSMLLVLFSLLSIL